MTEPRSDGPRRPREFGRDGITGLVNHDRALRAREVSKPTQADIAQAEAVIDQLIARAAGRRNR